METQQITPQNLDETRKTGYRPTVVACCVYDKKVLLLFKKEYNLWLFVQGGVDTSEELLGVLDRELKEEMGESFLQKCGAEKIFVGEEQVEFLPEKQTGEELTTAEGQSFKMIGKHYYFYCVPVSDDQIKLEESDFSEYYWFDSKPALILASKIYQPGKKRITMKAISLLKEKGLID